MQLYHWKIILLKQNPFIVKISDSCIIYFILYIAKELKPKTWHRRVGWLAAPRSEPNQMQLYSWTWPGSLRTNFPWILSESWMLSKCSNWRSDCFNRVSSEHQCESEPSTAWASRVWRTGPGILPGAPWPAATAGACRCGRGGWRGWGPGCLACRQCTEPRQEQVVQQCSAMTTSWKLS